MNNDQKYGKFLPNDTFFQIFEHCALLQVVVLCVGDILEILLPCFSLHLYSIVQFSKTFHDIILQNINALKLKNKLKFSLIF